MKISKQGWAPSVARNLLDVGQIRKELKAQLTANGEADRVKDFLGNQGEVKRKQDDYVNAAFQLAIDDATEDRATDAVFKVLETSLSDPDVTIKKSKNLGGGINKTEFVKLSNGLAAVWKPDEGSSGSKVHRNIPLGGDTDRDISAYTVDKHLGHIAGVPPTIKREFEGKPGVLTLFLGGAETAAMSLEARNELLFGGRQDASKPITILDNVIGNLDRHGGNWMLTPTGAPVPIDHGLTFPNQNGNQGRAGYHFHRSVSLNEEDKATLESFLEDRDEVSAELEPNIGERATGAMWRRVEMMLEDGEAGDAWLGETRIWRPSATRMGHLKNQKYGLNEIPGLSKKGQKALKEAGFKNTLQVANYLGPRHRRKSVERGKNELAPLNEAFSPKQLLDLISISDLMRLSGIGPRYAEMLQDSGVRSLPDLARRVPENLAEKVADLGAAPKTTPGIGKISKWIEKAKLMTPRVKH